MRKSNFSFHFLMTTTLLFFSILMIRCSKSQQVEVQALQFKQKLNDPQNHLINLEDSQSPCHFSGITCNSTSGKVTTVSLANMNLSGEISPSLATLQSLTILDLGDNSISGHIPSELMNCVNLQVLNLSTNSFNGHLPDFSFLKNLQVLDLSSNAFSGGFPAWLGNLIALVSSLGLASNKFDEGEIPQRYKQQFQVIKKASQRSQHLLQEMSSIFEGILEEKRKLEVLARNEPFVLLLIERESGRLIDEFSFSGGGDLYVALEMERRRVGDASPVPIHTGIANPRAPYRCQP